MRRSFRRTLAYATVVAVLLGSMVPLGGTAAAASLTLTACGAIVDGGGGDPDGTVNGLIAVAGCGLPGGGTFTGTVQELAGPNFYKILVSPGTFTGAFIGEFARGTYGAFVGEGRLTAVFAGQLRQPPPAGGGNSAGAETFQASADATSFTNTPAVTPVWGPPAVATPLPAAIFGIDTNNGDYMGGGTLIAYLNYSVPAGEEFFLPASAEFTAAVAEPSTLLLLGLLAAGLTRLPSPRRRRP